LGLWEQFYKKITTARAKRFSIINIEKIKSYFDEFMELIARSFNLPGNSNFDVICSEIDKLKNNPDLKEDFFVA
jgi:hypothetical protein